MEKKSKTDLLPYPAIASTSAWVPDAAQAVPDHFARLSPCWVSAVFTTRTMEFIFVWMRI